ncbi:helix-turn-helix domain-containing protein, partial [Halorubrum tibetense]
MRELVFSLTYEPESNAVADVLSADPDARVRSLSLHATRESLWRVDHATGTPGTLDALEDAFLTADYYADCLADEPCGATQTTRVLEHTDDTLVCYSYWERTPTCTSVPHLAFDHLGEGLLFETDHRRREYRWRMIHAGTDGSDVRGFLDAVESAVGDAARMDIRRISEAGSSREDAGAASDELDSGLPSEQAAALRAAVEHGYYETPRAVDAAELADR